jgi:hypothetical protein
MIGRWRLVRTPDPRGEKDAISITHGAELHGSDPDFAGLMIRCGDKDVDVLAILLRPVPLRARPQVTVNGTKYEAKVAAPGTAILLPDEVTAAARERWRTLPSVSLAVDDGDSITKGMVSLEDFEPALKALTASCSAR